MRDVPGYLDLESQKICIKMVMIAYQ